MGEVLVPYGDDRKDTATLLLGAADDLGYEPWVVRHQPDDNGFRVPEDVAEKANATVVDEDAVAVAEEEERRKQIEVVQDPAGVAADGSPASKPAAKKAAAKKTPAKKTSRK